EIGVASTKAFTTQLALFAVLAGALARRTGAIDAGAERAWVEALLHLPNVIQKALDDAPKVEALARKYKDRKGFLYLGRGLAHPIALEGALKLKEIAYVHAEGYPAGELKHGPIAMVEPEILVLAIAPEGGGTQHQKSVSNIEEVRARKGTLLGLGAPGDAHFREICHDYIDVPDPVVQDLLAIVSVVPLQLFSYYVAVARGTEVDQPRNLAKSVTVE
ncbi:MAG: SIS domain-containing protein, partial [Bdellovibrionales bacterium]|nr:SIS domain-containing protein [Bdellovibrionales bacterium]